MRVGFSSAANGTSSFTGSVGISTSSTLVVYVVLDVGSGASVGETVEISINDPSAEVTAGAGTVGPAAAVAISGTTTLSAGCSPTINYRSIGTNPNPLANTGTASVNLGETTVTFSGVTLPTNIGQGDRIYLDTGGPNEERFILSRDSDTQVTLQQAAQNDHSAGVSYSIERAYSGASAIVDWEDARDGLLVAETRREVGVAYNDGIFKERPVIDGSTTDACHFMHLTVAEGQRHNGTAGTGVVLDAESLRSGIAAEDDYTIVEWFEIIRTGGAHGRSAVEAGAPNVLFQQLLIHDFYDAVFTGFGVKGSDDSNNLTVRNCIIYDGDEVGVATNKDNVPRYIAHIQNCTIYGMSGRGLHEDKGDFRVTNTIVMNSLWIDFDMVVGTQSNNMSSDFTATGLQDKTALDQFISISPAIDLHLKVGSDAIDSGTDLSASFTGDIDDQIRGGIWDMGADEFLPPNLQIHYRWRNDDGGESGASWAAPEDTPLVGLPKSTLQRFRFEVSNEGVDSSTAQYRLQVAHTAACNEGTYSDVPTGSTQHWQIIGSANIADGEPTTNVDPGLTDEASTFKPGEVRDAANTTGSITLNPDEFTEIEFAVLATANATNGGYYCFRLFDLTSGTPLDSYAVYPQVTLAGSGDALTLADVSGGQVLDKLGTTTPKADTFFQFNLSRSGEANIDNIRVRFSTDSGITGIDVSECELWRDDGNGIWDDEPTDTKLRDGVMPSDGVLSFNALNEDPIGGTNYFVRATLSNLKPGDRTTFSLGPDNIDEVQVGVTESGAISNATHIQDADPSGTREVIYSVGTSYPNDLRNGSPFITIINGTAYLDTPQTINDIGVGDVIEYDTDKNVYIKSVIGPTELVVQTATGGMPTDTGGAIAIDTIRRAFGSIATAVDSDTGGSGAAALLGENDLVTGDYTLTFVCYNDGVFAEEVIINGYATDEAHFVTLTVAGALQEPVSNGYAGATYTITRAYNTFQAWEDDRDGDLIGDNRREIGVTYDDGAFTVGVTFDDSTSDACHNMWLTVALGHRHDGSSNLTGSIVYMTAGDNPQGEITIRDDYTVVEWLLLRHVKDASVAEAAAVTVEANDVLLSNLIINESEIGIRIEGAGGHSFTARNCIIHQIDNEGIRGNVASDGATIENCSLYSMTGNGVDAKGGTFDVVNTISLYGALDFVVSGGFHSNNMSSDSTAPGANPKTGAAPGDIFVNIGVPPFDLHLKTGSEAIDAGIDRSSRFNHDIDSHSRPAGTDWDIGADEFDGTTEVELRAFVATGYDGEVLLEWETATEVDNLGFYMYRSELKEGPYTLVNEVAVPGLGSSPIGARYHYVDSGLTNGTTYYYELEDFEASGKRTRHGPVSATPTALPFTTWGPSPRSWRRWR